MIAQYLLSAIKTFLSTVYFNRERDSAELEFKINCYVLLFALLCKGIVNPLPFIHPSIVLMSHVAALTLNPIDLIPIRGIQSINGIISSTLDSNDGYTRTGVEGHCRKLFSPGEDLVKFPSLKPENKYVVLRHICTRMERRAAQLIL